MRPQPRLALAIASAAFTNGATATATAIDTCPGTVKYDHLVLPIRMTTADVVSNKPSVLKLQHSDTTDATNYSDISGFVGGTDFTIPNADTSNSYAYLFNVNLRGKKRYIKAAVSPRTTQTIFAEGVLLNGKESPTTAALANAIALVEG